MINLQWHVNVNLGCELSSLDCRYYNKLHQITVIRKPANFNESAGRNLSMPVIW